MSRTDIIADSFTIIRNGLTARKEDVFLPFSNIMMQVCRILKREGYIEDFMDAQQDNFKKIKVYLKYKGRKSAIREIKKVSRPGRRAYSARKDIRPVLRGFGLSILSTSKGILSDTEAREQNVGGEVLGTIW